MCVCEREGEGRRGRERERQGERERELEIYRKVLDFFATDFVSCNGPCAPKETWHRKEHIIIIIKLYVQYLCFHAVSVCYFYVHGRCNFAVCKTSIPVKYTTSRFVTNQTELKNS